MIQGQRQTDWWWWWVKADRQAGQGLHTKQSFFFARNAQEYTNNVFSTFPIASV